MEGRNFERIREGYESKESIEKLPEADALIILGGGIDQVSTEKAKSFANLWGFLNRQEKVWRPSRYVVRPDPKLPGDKRTGLRKPFTKDETLEASDVVHGGTAHLLAGIQYAEEMKARGMLPKRLIFAAGRPDYISNATEDPEADEGKVMRDQFEKRTAGEDLSGMEIEVRGKGSKNTTGDLINGLKAAWDAKLRSAVIVVTEARKERTEEMCKYLQKRYPELGGITVSFVTAEDLLLRRYRPGTEARKRFDAIQKVLSESTLIQGVIGENGEVLEKGTIQREQGGTKQIREGSYRFQINPDIDTSGLTDTKKG